MKTLVLPGRVDDLVREGMWKVENKWGWIAYNNGRHARHGKGARYIVTVPDEVAADLKEYLVSIRDALASMTSEERGRSGDTELRALNSAFSRWPG